MANAKLKKKSRVARAPTTSTAPQRKSVSRLRKNANGVVMLSGGNPQIAKGDGDAPVQDYIRNMPEWKRLQGRKLDALIVKTVPGVRKAVKWNSPFYGVEGQGWFLAFHVFTRYIKVTFFRGSSLKPLPPVPSKDPHARYLHIEEDGFDDVQVAEWIRQAAAIPGWMA